ncbi:MAG: peptidoglycan DD-metalloendopeptidase family protein, partial [Bacteroidetes bacterium]|nr:peptidoglycan DD-metalloendopeptidase family protein [Bacteroidota bacterium]
MATRKKRKQSLYEALQSKYRLVVMNDDTFEEQASFKLSRINLFVIISAVLFVIVLVITSVIIFTPIKEWIPGYADVNLRRDLIYLKLKADSIEKVVDTRTLYLNARRDVLTEKVDTGKGESTAENMPENSLSFAGISLEDSSLRAEMEGEEYFMLNFSNMRPSRTSVADFAFFTPVRGFITEDFDRSGNHFGVDVVAPENETIQAVLDGTVIMATWTLETGHVIALQHENQLVSFYKHNSVLLKKVGNFVRAGDAIAIIGSSG